MCMLILSYTVRMNNVTCGTKSVDTHSDYLMLNLPNGANYIKYHTRVVIHTDVYQNKSLAHVIERAMDELKRCSWQMTTSIYHFSFYHMTLTLCALIYINTTEA